MTTSDGAVIGTTQIFGSAPRQRAFNIVLLGDGFRDTEQASFNTAADAFVTALTGTAPFDQFLPAINIFRVNVRSTDSGADDPASAGGTGATARTYFDASFGGAGVRRLLLADSGTVLTVAAAQVPEFSLALLVVNSTVYGGAGGAIGTYSLAGGATEIAIHEAGHTAFGLADEYPYWQGGNEPDRAHHPGPEPGAPNVTRNTDRATLKWRWAVNAATALPTQTNPDPSTEDYRPSPVPAGTVGCFEGAHYYHAGAYRPEWDCKMRNLWAPFCTVCTAVIGDRLRPLLTQQTRASAVMSVVARYPEHLDVFAVAPDGRCVTNWWDVSTGWAGWSSLMGGVASPGGAGSPVTAVSRFDRHLDLFTVGTDDRVYTAWWNQATGWSGWSVLGSIRCRPGSVVTALSRYTDQLDLFTTDRDGRTMTLWWTAAGGWARDWQHISGGVAANGAPVTAVARRPHHLDIFTVGTDNRVYSAWWDQRSGWSRWFTLPGITCRPDSTVTVVSRLPDQIDLFTTDSSGKVMTTWWNVNGGWARGWHQVAGGVASPGSDVSAIARGSAHLDLFVVGTDNRVYSTWWHEGGAWAPWFNVSGGVSRPGGQVAAITRLDQQIDLFVTGSDGLTYSTWWNASGGWARWFQLTVT